MERAVPILPADDLRVAKEFYVDRLGFTVRSEATGGARTFDVIDPFGNTIFVMGPVK